MYDLKIKLGNPKTTLLLTNLKNRGLRPILVKVYKFKLSRAQAYSIVLHVY